MRTPFKLSPLAFAALMLLGCNAQDAAAPAQGAAETAPAPAPAGAAAVAAPAPEVDHLDVKVVADATPHQLQAATVEGDALVATGEPGFVMYGPYATVAAGRYVLAVQGDVESLGDGAVIVDVASKGKTFGEQTITQTQAQGDISEIAFVLEQPTADLEFRARVGKGAKIRITGYTLARAE